MIDRPRRLRRGQAMRDLVAETDFTPADLVLPLFIRAGKDERKPIDSMPGVAQLTADLAVEELKRAEKAGIKGYLLFGITPDKKLDAEGAHALDPENEVCTAVKMARDAGIEMVAISDLCFCEYTKHGHCGVLDKDPLVTVDNDETLENLGRQALNHAEAGFDIVAPSGMMDGMVGEVRDSLDGEGYENVAIMAYAIKQASAFYGPFREAVQSAPEFGDRKGYQMDVRNWREAMREAALDQAQGADILMVKPGMPCLDLLARLREETSLPLAAYQVSGEYAMIKAAAANGWLDGDACMREAMQAFKRAGANMVITYAALELAESF